MSSLSDQRVNKRSAWKWWQSAKTTEYKDKHDVTSIAPSSLVVHHSIHSKEFDEDMLSTASIKSKPWISQKLKTTSISPVQQEEQEETDQNTMNTLQLPQNKTETNSRDISHNNSKLTPSQHITNNDPTTPSSSSILNNAPSITSSTVPVINFNPHRKSSDTVFSGIRAKFGKWVNRTGEK